MFPWSEVTRIWGQLILLYCISWSNEGYLVVLISSPSNMPQVVVGYIVPVQPPLNQNTWNNIRTYILINSCGSHRYPLISLTICTYHPLLLVGLLDCIQCLHRTDVCESLLAGQHWHIHENVTYEFVLSSMSLLLGWFLK